MWVATPAASRGCASREPDPAQGPADAGATAGGDESDVLAGLSLTEDAGEHLAQLTRGLDAA